ncbi:restriction endonuclease [Kitasatospora sp. MMS16-BH015]|uniref:Uma2 family endonuclease n=1 Tax=Kitasatospora sp. MMS16-BH015 TaxID=2018025 RepID=UPI000CA2D911|nr:Uma2 family endonuclease [Kitasatospora sp. MMS16-BH015]AUG80103.1 restriction endonuclease [Kitasatospora sp. MMS16-BH015]
MSSLPDWMYPPREEGWYAEDLDRLTEAPRHTELIDGALVFMMSPQRSWHSRVVSALTFALEAQAPEELEVEREMTIRLDRRNRPEPDLVVAKAEYRPNRTWFDPSEVLLVVEVVSPESEHRDRTMKPRKYAEAGIPSYWRIEHEVEQVVAYVHELDDAVGAYGSPQVYQRRLERKVPFPLTLELDQLERRRRGN